LSRSTWPWGWKKADHEMKSAKNQNLLPRSSAGLREERAELESFHSRQRVVHDQRSVEMLLIHINTNAPARELS
jgi:hypothetical protein